MNINTNVEPKLDNIKCFNCLINKNKNKNKNNNIKNKNIKLCNCCFNNYYITEPTSMSRKKSFINFLNNIKYSYNNIFLYNNHNIFYCYCYKCLLRRKILEETINKKYSKFGRSYSI